MAKQRAQKTNAEKLAKRETETANSHQIDGLACRRQATGVGATSGNPGIANRQMEIIQVQNSCLIGVLRSRDLCDLRLFKQLKLVRTWGQLLRKASHNART